MCNCQAKEYKPNQCDKCRCKSNCALYINYVSCKKSCDKLSERQSERRCEKPCKRSYEKQCERLCESVCERPSKCDKDDKNARNIYINIH